MGTATYDSADKIISVINDNWTAGQAPNIQKAWNRRSVGFIDDRMHFELTNGRIFR